MFCNTHTIQLNEPDLFCTFEMPQRHYAHYMVKSRCEKVDETIDEIQFKQNSVRAVHRNTEYSAKCKFNTIH